jgi:hypothetical protein
MAAWLQCALHSREIKPLVSPERKKFFYDGQAHLQDLVEIATAIADS